MMFNPKHKKKIKVAWSILAALVIISMILLYAPIFQQ